MSLFLDYKQTDIEAHQRIYDQRAGERVTDLKRHAYYYGLLRDMLRYLVEPDRRVLCIRSDLGQYLEWVKPSYGKGIDISENLIALSRERYPQFEFRLGIPEEIEYFEKFDYILIINAINDQFDVQRVLENLKPACEPHTRIIITLFNFLWQPACELAQRVGLKRLQPQQNWLSTASAKHLIRLSGYELVQQYHGVLTPFYFPLLSWFLNKPIVKLPLMDKLALVQAYVVRPEPDVNAPPQGASAPSVSVIIPCKNEKGNIRDAVERTPEMGRFTELIFCDDKSTDGTPDEVLRMQALHPEKRIRLVDGPGICKAENVWTGFDAAEGDILMILDGDLTVPPEELSKFYQAINEGRGEFINGSRLIYPIRDQAMRLANIFGNKMFNLLFSHIIRQEIGDTLCGTKVLWRKDYERIKRFRGTWGTQDRWGDHELIFGAARLSLKHLDLPVHYMERTYGDTKMTGRLRQAWFMLRMCMAAYAKLLH